MMKCFNKRGISPLIATVLIIGFTVALAAVVMTWGTGFVRSTTDSTAESTNVALACSRMNYKITNVGCTGTTINTVEISNDGETKIEELILRAALPGQTLPLTAVDTSLEGISLKTISITTGALAATPEKVIAIAKIKTAPGSETFACADTPAEFLVTCA